MKKVVTVVMMLIGISLFAQEPQEGKKPKFTTEQQANIRLKKLTLDLDLSDAQARQLQPIVLEQAKKRSAMQASRKAMKAKGEKPSADQRYEMIMAHLDEQIALNKRVKKILNEQQYEQWKKMQKRKGKHHRGHKKPMHKGKKMERK